MLKITNLFLGTMGKNRTEGAEVVINFRTVGCHISDEFIDKILISLRRGKLSIISRLIFAPHSVFPWWELRAPKQKLSLTYSRLCAVSSLLPLNVQVDVAGRELQLALL